MAQALDLAAQAGKAGEIPVGAVLVDTTHQTLIAVGENRRERDQDPTAHGEILALRRGGQALKTWHLNHCTLYVTLEPCAMCAGAIVLARLGGLVYGADDPKTGAIQTVFNLPNSLLSNHRLNVIPGILRDTCSTQLSQWFEEQRRSSKAPSQQNL